MNALVRRWIWLPAHRRLMKQEGADVIPPADSPEWKGFHLFLDRLAARAAQFTGLSICVAVVACWPTDRFVARGDPHVQHVFAIWRASVLAALLPPSLALRYWPWAQKRPVWLTMPFSVAVTVACAALVGEISSPEVPWLYYLYFLPVLGIAIPAQGALRVLHCVALALAIVLGFFVLHPRHWSNRWTPDALFFLGVVVAISMIAAYFSWAQLVIGYFQKQRMIYYAKELSDLNATLDARVLEKTRELRALTEHLEVVREEERTRLARELHDDLGQQLSAARYALADARREHARGAPSASDLLATTERMLADAADTTRHIVGTLRPLILEQLGLTDACEWLSAHMAERAGLTCRFTATGNDEDLDDRIALSLYRVLQEALTNVVKHAEARSVEVSLDISKTHLSLMVTDDGRGLPADLPRRRDGGGLGLIGMRERAESQGGTLSVERGEQGGTRVHLEMPRTRPSRNKPDLATGAPR
ncbi:MAG: sensor histidine kinase [Polyangiaceae bacterium]